MFALVTVPLAAVTLQVCDGAVGCVRIVTSYNDPLATAPANTKLPLAATAKSPPPFNCNCSPAPANPVTVPATV